ncbi:beta-ketoacyl-ACP synthase II [Candidatus Binatia bacterium]|nr:beta-ketoacyl-ACP synthase II [Candidatus Binatia bacterium]
MPRSLKRVVVTGLGLVTPLGNDVAGNWDALMAGRSGIDRITHFDSQALGLPVHIAGEVRDFDPARYIEKREIKKMDTFTYYAIAAAQEAVDDAQLRMEGLVSERVGVLLGVGMGGLATMEEGVRVFLESGIKRVTAFLVPRLIANMASSQVGIRFGARGVNFVTTSACASGGHGVGEAFRNVTLGLQDVVLAGGAEAVVTPLGIAGFAVMRALSTRNDEPARASRPFERDRDGFVLAEGAGILVLEELEHARRRGARIYAEVVGYGANSDAYHITAPAPEGEGAARCMRLALADAELAPGDVDYINAHGTSTPYNDLNETQAIKRVFGSHANSLAVSSTKSMTGHTMGAAGGIEAAYTVLALHHQVLPPTINYEQADPECDLDYVPNRARPARVRAALSNSFGFGGANACLAFRRWE